MKISDKAEALIEAVKGCKGQFVHVEYVTHVKTSAAHKNKVIKKYVQGVFRTGIDYANLKSVREGIANGERGEVKPLPWGQWAVHPWIIEHKGEEYIRLFQVKDSAVISRYLVEIDSEPQIKPPGITSKEWVATFLTPADAEKLLSDDREAPECITKKISDVSVIGCWTSEAGIEKELARWSE